MTRRQARDHLFIMLFRKEFHEISEMDQQADFYLEFMESTQPLTKEESKELKERFNNIIDKLPEIDAILTKTSTGWKLNRMGKVDLTVMRIAIFEIKFDKEIPNAVAINEAVEIAKKYGEESSGSFVNGVLAKMLR
ncbi:MAG TPA: transcription antitermination factor NusB [Clostridiales bacterium]|nr:transcription antitermination factor NusB [Clostridiales bacterium]